jgi:hypothetical protein
VNVLWAVAKNTARATSHTSHAPMYHRVEVLLLTLEKRSGAHPYARYVL